MFLYDFATKTAQKPDTVATYIRRNEKIFKNHVERREKQLWLDEKAVKILLKKYPEVQRKKYPWWKNETEFQEAMVSAIKGLWDNQEILQKELDGILTTIEELQDAMDHTEPQKENNGLISLEKLFGEDEDTQVDKLKRQVKGKYVVFHSNRFIGENSYQSALKELMELSKTYKILLLPLAVTNDDYDILKKLYKDSNEIFILPSEQLTMEEIVSYLAFCDLYIGVSFHGAITAFCYGNPVVGFDFVHNKKTRDLYDQLGLSEQYVSDESMLHDGIKCAFEREQKQLKSVYKNMKQKVDMHFDEIADSLTKNNQGGYNEAFLSFSDVIDEMSGLLSVLSNQYRDRTGVIEKYKSEAQYNLLNWQKCSNEMIELYNKYQKLADEYKELKERMECKEKL